MLIILSGVALGLLSALLICLGTHLTKRWHYKAGFGVAYSAILAVCLLPSLRLQIALLSFAREESSDIRVMSILCWVFIAMLPCAWMIYKAATRSQDRPE